ncbi:putative bifunctional diguanylate cyclase/phosphodiesterase [Alteromonas oceanisediminis]|uniref:putative bifunctional diguanylate cyclase/phosphodiesterase n=1 Tax=Alteromonas oceanisediminis TaxID=2836180 RepID=UPI001BD952C3|nr:EAL domain-containing protein [Alteromonas oceanisediminis]MBT0587291.1 EAL domain-containing protein [Alteromonas oceanisediminis]
MRDLSRFTILAVDDDSINLRVIAQQLAPLAPRLLVATDGQSALSVTQRELPDLILLDINMPGMSGLDVCRAVKESEKTADIPIIFLTSSEQDTAEAFSVGGVDYIVKPVDSDALQARVCTHLHLSASLKALDETNLLLSSANERLEKKVEERTRELVNTNANLRREINERRSLQDKLSFLSHHDFVTRMYNRFALEEKLTEQMASAETNSTKGFLCLTDLDQFKIVNDTCGYLAGDEILRQLAEVLRGQLDKDDIAARIGGDEFAVYFRSADMGFAIAKVRAVKSALENFEFEWMGDRFKHSVSMGLVEIDESIDSVSHLISVAERTCYQSKLKGGGEISVYNVTRAHVDKTQQQMRLVPLIRQALEEERIKLHVQAIHCTQNDTITKAEVLSRMRDGTGRLQPPSYFIPVAEKFHIIDAIDKYVLTKSIEALKTLPEKFQLSVNISGEFIGKEGAVDFITGLLTSNAADPSQLCIEITESSAISNLDATIEFISRLKPLGCEFSLDDFGTGTSSYEYLKKLAIDIVKIDGMFVRDVETDAVNRRMIESIVAIAKAKSIRVVAECVETQAAKALLETLDIDYLQGFGLHEPEDIDVFSNNLSHR